MELKDPSEAAKAPAAAKPDSAKQPKQGAAVTQMAGASSSRLVSQARAAPQPRPAAGATRAHKRLKATNGPRALGPFWQWENVAALCAGKAKLLCTGDETEDAMWSKLYEDNLGAVLVEWRVSNMSEAWSGLTTGGWDLPPLPPDDSPGFRGVALLADGRLWAAFTLDPAHMQRAIMQPDKANPPFFGMFEEREKSIMTYDLAALKSQGLKAELNEPLSRYLALLGGQKQLLGMLEQLDLCDVAAKAEELYELDPFRLPSPPQSP